MDWNSLLQNEGSIRRSESKHSSRVPDIIDLTTDSDEDIVQDSRSIQHKAPSLHHPTAIIQPQSGHNKRNSNVLVDDVLVTNATSKHVQVGLYKKQDSDRHLKFPAGVPSKRIRPSPDEVPKPKRPLEVVRRSLVRPTSQRKPLTDFFTQVASPGSVRDTGIRITPTAFEDFVEHRPSPKPRSQATDSSTESIQTRKSISTSSTIPQGITLAKTNQSQDNHQSTARRDPFHILKRATQQIQKATDTSRIDGPNDHGLVGSVHISSEANIRHQDGHVHMQNDRNLPGSVQKGTLKTLSPKVPLRKTISTVKFTRRKSTSEPSLSMSESRSEDDQVQGQRRLRRRNQTQTEARRRREEWILKYQDHRLVRQAKTLHPLVEIVNEVDDDPPPSKFRFISKNKITGQAVPPDPEAIYGCSCAPGVCSPTDCSCIHERNVQLKSNGKPWGNAYDHNGLLTNEYLKSDLAIFECNEKCSCPPTCRNRLVQNGRQFDLEIFKTVHRGWGLRSTDFIRKGAFVDTYRGEILTETEARARSDQCTTNDSQLSNSSGSNIKSTTRKTRKDIYLFDLDKFQDTIEGLGIHTQQVGLYVIDGEFLGSPGRFINHSCDPNLGVYAVSLLRGNPRLYELAFFARRDIPPGEELSFDYQAGKGDDDDDDNDDIHDDNENNDDSRKQDCLCGADNCRGRFW